MEIISREFQGIEINFSKETDLIYLNATQTAKKFNKKPDNWLRNKDVKDYIKRVSLNLNLNNNELVLIKQGGSTKEQGTWIHKSLETKFLEWCKKENRNKSSFLYFITDGEYTKIGVTRNIKTRLRSLQIGNARFLKCVYSVELENFSKAENILHSQFQSKRVIGEWFNLTIEDIELAKSLVQSLN
jgi:hypothetical protein